MESLHGNGSDEPRVLLKVNLSERHGRLYATVADTDIQVSARSVASLRSKLMAALDLHPGGSPAQIYWSIEGRATSGAEGVDGLTGWQIHRQAEVDRKLRALRGDGTNPPRRP